MTPITSLPPAERFALIIGSLLQGLSRRAGVKGIGALPGPLLLLIWARLRRIAVRFAHHAATPPSPSQSRPRLASPRLARPIPPLSLPRRKSWLMILIPETAHGAGQLRDFLAEPEVQSLLAATPQLRRILRPLCRMLHIHINPTTLRPVPAPPNKPPPAPRGPFQAPKPSPAAAILALWPPRPTPSAPGSSRPGTPVSA